MAGSRPGAIIAGTWAAVNYLGRNGYVKAAKEIMQATSIMRKG
jgi:sphinganine-1-phosphate aldolase